MRRSAAARTLNSLWSVIQSQVVHKDHAASCSGNSALRRSAGGDESHGVAHGLQTLFQAVLRASCALRAQPRFGENASLAFLTAPSPAAVSPPIPVNGIPIPPPPVREAAPAHVRPGPAQSPMCHGQGGTAGLRAPRTRRPASREGPPRASHHAVDTSSALEVILDGDRASIALESIGNRRPKNASLAFLTAPGPAAAPPHSFRQRKLHLAATSLQICPAARGRPGPARPRMCNGQGGNAGLWTPRTCRPARRGGAPQAPQVQPNTIDNCLVRG